MEEVDERSTATKKKMVPVSGAVLGSAVAVAMSPGEALFRRRIEFHPARKVGADFGGSGDFRVETLNPSSDAHGPVAGLGGGKAAAAAGVVGEKRGKRSDEHGLDPEISFSITFRRIGAGLANLGNTCFLNSVLQCLTYTEPFAAYLQSGKHKSSCHTPGFCALCALQNHVMTALQSSGKILTPSHLVKNLRSISRNFRNARQEDAHEYMVNLLESMHKCCLPSGVPSESPSAYEKSLVHKIFGGRLRSQVKCTQCSYSSNKFDPFLDLSLEITKADSLHKALSHFTAIEQLDGGERQYQCQRCKQKVRALKQLTVHKAPYVLTIHLKRFGSVIPGQKIDRKVNFEPTLDLKPFVSDQQEGNFKYTLYGVLVHAGWSTHSGHYYCYVRTSSGLWHSLNDNQVSQVSEKVVLAQKAYMLFYIRNRSSAPKRPVYTNTSGNRCLDVSSLSLKEKTQNGSVDRRLCNSEQSLAISKVDALLPDKTISAKAVPSDDFVTKKDSSFPSVGLGLPREVQALQSNGYVEKESDCSLRFPSSKESSSDSDAPKGVVDQYMAESLTESDSSSKENSCRMMVKNLVISLSNANKENTVKELTWSAFSNGNVDGKDVITDVMRQNQCNDPPTHVSGNLPNNEADGVSSKAADDLRPDKIEALKLTSHSREVRAQQVSVVTERFQRDQTGQSAGEIFQKKQIIDSSSQPTTSKHHLQKEILADTWSDHMNSVNNETVAKIKKSTKHSHKKKMHFGPRHLLFASLSLRKKRKLKRSRKKCLHKKNLIKSEVIGTFVSGDQETSTSEMVNIVSTQKMHSAKKQSLSHSKKEKLYSTRDDCSDNGSDKKFAAVRSVENNVLANSGLPETTLKQNTSHPGVRAVDMHVKNSIRSSFMESGESFAIPKWDDEGPQSSIHEVQNTQAGSIGYVLDEWDEEYDRGKRKKVKKSGQFFTITNPFEEIAMRNRQQKMKRMKFDHSSSANQPFRI